MIARSIPVGAALWLAAFATAQDEIRARVVTFDGKTPDAETCRGLRVRDHPDLVAHAPESEVLATTPQERRVDAHGHVEVPAFVGNGTRGTTLVAYRTHADGSVSFSQVEGGLRPGGEVVLRLRPDRFRGQQLRVDGLAAWPAREPFAFVAVADGELHERAPFDAERGLLTLPPMPAERVELYVLDAGGRLLCTADVPTRARSAEDGTRTLEIPAPCAIRIDVENEEGEPAPEARLTRRGHIVAFSDPAGSMRLDLALPGEQSGAIEVRGPTGFWIESPGLRTTLWTGYPDVAWYGNHAVAQLPVGEDLRGQLIGPRGEPCAGAPVVLHTVRPTPRGFRVPQPYVTFADRGGVFELPGIATHLPDTMFLHASIDGGLVVVSLDDLARGAGRVGALRVAHLRHHDLRFHEPDGAIADDTHYELFTQVDTLRDFQRSLLFAAGRADRAGRLQLWTSAATTVELFAWSRHGGTGRLQIHDQTAIPLRADCVAIGSVLDQKGLPVLGAEVRMRDRFGPSRKHRRTEVEADGSFVLPLPTPGSSPAADVAYRAHGSAELRVIGLQPGPEPMHIEVDR